MKNSAANGLMMKNKDNLEKIIANVINKFIFPDGCLDLGGDEQSAFAGTLADEIMEKWVDDE